MTPFETIILIVIYMFCFGFVSSSFLKEEDNVWRITFLSIASLVLAIYAPITIGGMLYNKLSEKENIKG